MYGLSVAKDRIARRRRLRIDEPEGNSNAVQKDSPCMSNIAQHNGAHSSIAIYHRSDLGNHR